MSFSLYIHVPFCLSRCPYCAFYSGESLRLLPLYGAWIERELARTPAEAHWSLGPVDTVYFGGGTPSLLDPSSVASILATVRGLWGFSLDAEVTLEANPGDALDLPALRAAGVNRLSVGVQALDDDALALLGRRHSADSALRALSAAVREDFRTSADLIFGLPGLDPNAFSSWAHRLRNLDVEHVSTYSLEVHAETAFARLQKEGTLLLPSPSEEATQWDALHAALESSGFRPYEVSNYSLPRAECRHNLAYWEGGTYLGLGPGAHGFAPSQGPWGTRRWNEPDLAAYAAALENGRLPPRSSEALDEAASLLERLFLSLRRPAAIDFRALAARYGVNADRLHTRLAQAVDEGLLTRPLDRPDCHLPTLAGTRTADGLALWLSETFASDPRWKKAADLPASHISASHC